jgi:GT2 family glycosyltransferase
MWDTARLRELGGFDERYLQAEDAELVNRAVYERGWPLQVIPEALTAYRITEVGLSSSGLSHQRRVLRYLEERNRRWARGLPAISLVDFLHQNGSLRTRSRWWRHDTGAALYRRAGIRIGHRRRLAAVLSLAGAAVLHPRYVARKLRHQIGGRAIPEEPAGWSAPPSMGDAPEGSRTR